MDRCVTFPDSPSSHSLPWPSCQRVPASAATGTTSFVRWSSSADFAQGTSVGLAATSGALTLGKGTSVLSYDDPRVSGGAKKYDSGSWTSPWQSTGFSAKSLIPSWTIQSPTGTWARIEVRVKSGSTTGSWDTIANYAFSASYIKRASGSAQTDDLAKLSTDTVLANSGKSFTSWQVRVLLMRPVGAKTTPTLEAVNGTQATYATRTISTSSTTMTKTKELAVPMSSQMIHKGEYPEWGGGGEAWCSPTSTSMVMRYFGTGPTAADYSWTSFQDGFVDHAARYTFDYAYDGTGNWPFNTAYAARHSLDAFVTRLHTLRDAEAFINAGIPLVASIAFGKGELDGARLVDARSPGRDPRLHVRRQRHRQRPGSIQELDGPARLQPRTVREGVAAWQWRRRVRHPARQPGPPGRHHPLVSEHS